MTTESQERPDRPDPDDQREMAELTAKPGGWALRLAGLMRWLVVLTLGGAAAVVWWQASAPAQASGEIYTCPMHPTYQQPGRGACPVCGMDLVPKAGLGQGGAAAADPGASFRLQGVAGVAATRVETGRLQRAGVRSAAVEKRDLELATLLPGQLALDPIRRFAVTARTAGWLQRVAERRPGELFKAGETLAVLYSRELHEAQAEYLATAQLEQTSHGAGETATGGMKSAAGERLVRLGMGRGGVKGLGKARGVAVVTAPKAGMVIDRPFEAGRYVSVADPLWLAADLAYLLAVADVPQTLAAQLHPGQEVELVLADDKVVQGQILSPEVDGRADVRTVRLRALVHNGDGALRPGMLARWRLVQKARQVLAVPEDALIDVGHARYVQRLGKGGLVTPTRVETGLRADGWVEIRAGLVEGDRIAVSGVFLVDAETRLAAGVPEPATATAQPAAAAPAEKAHDHADHAGHDHQHGGGTGGPEAALQPAQVQPVIDAYLLLGDALVESNAKVALAKAEELRKVAQKAQLALKGLDAFPQDLAEQRKRLGELSEQVIALARRAGLSSELQVVWCSMAPGRWLQRAGEVANPYYGAEMLRCGDIQGAPTAAPQQAPSVEEP